jgi:Skp family chaperone for outer membrane proteins
MHLQKWSEGIWCDNLSKPGLASTNLGARGKGTWCGFFGAARARILAAVSFNDAKFGRVCRLSSESILFLAVTLLVCTIVTPAYADFRLATVDINKVLNESSSAKAERKKLDDKAASARKKLEERGKALRTRKEALDRAEANADPKDIERFRADARDFERDVKDTDEDLKKEFLKVNRQLAERAVSIVTAYAKQNNISLVLDKGEESRGPVLFGQPTFDITPEIVKEMNKS